LRSRFTSGLWLVLIALLPMLSAPAAAQKPPPPPKKYQALYSELDAALTAFERQLPPVAPGSSVLRAATLGSASCTASDDMLSESRREAIALELTALRNVGADAAVLEVCYPLLTPEYQDPSRYLEHYANLANEIRLRDLKLVVVHAALRPTPANPALQRYWNRLSRQRYSQQRFAEAKTILYALQPDYLTLASDPPAQIGGTKLRPRDWARELQAEVDGLRRDTGRVETLLGAGTGLWGDGAVVEAFAGVRGLDYIDLRTYPVWANGRDLLPRLLEWPARVRAIDAQKRIIISEAWLRKASRSDPSHGPGNDQILPRETYNFWEPLDQRWLGLLGRAARSQGIELVGVSRPQHFFAYVDFYDPTIFRLANRSLVDVLSRRFADAVRSEPPTGTGRAFGAM
jgi:hypothetical protein